MVDGSGIVDSDVDLGMDSGNGPTDSPSSPVSPSGIEDGAATGSSRSDSPAGSR